MKNPDHYEQNSILRLIEFYMLWNIDDLSECDRNILEAIAPKLKVSYGGAGTSQQAIAAAMYFPPDMPDRIRQMWTKNREIARANQTELPAQAFAEMFVDANFAN